MSLRERSLDSPVGRLTVIAGEDGIVGVEWRDGRRDESDLLDRAEAELAAYFDGSLRQFTLPLHIRASQFQQDVCAAMSAIPFGETRTYGDLAAALGVPAQAIGQACGGNPIPIIVPCHRVLGALGLGGYSGAGGIETKVALLRHEGAAGLLI